MQPACAPVSCWGRAAFGAGGRYWHDLLGIVLTGAPLLGAGLHGGLAMRRFLLRNAARLLLLLSDLGGGRELALWREPAGRALQLSDIA